MVLLKSDPIRAGFQAPSFCLQGVDGKTYRLESFKDKKVLVVMFICNHCPYVKSIEDRLIALEREFNKQSVQLVGVCANDPTDYPDDAPEALKVRWQHKDYRFPYLVDETQEIARAYGAVCTPDLYVFDDQRRLAYRGRLDDNWQEPAKVSRRDLAEAVNALLKGEKPADKQQPSMGCSIKWRKGS